MQTGRISTLKEPLLGEMMIDGNEKNIDDMIMEMRSHSTFYLWKNRSEHVEIMGSVKHVIDLFKQFEQGLVNRPGDTLYLLYSLEQRFEYAPPESQKFMRMFSAEVEKLFQPVPSANVLKDFCVDLVQFLESPYGSLGYSHSDWGRAKRHLKWPKYDALRATMPAEEDGLCLEIIQKLMDLLDKYRKYTALDWFLNGMLRAVQEGKYTFLSISELVVVGEDCAAKKLLPWTVVGWLSYSCLQYQVVEPKHFVYGETTKKFQTFMTSTTPGFIFKLTEMLGVLAGQEKNVSDYQSKVLAGFVTGGISMVSFLMKFLWEWNLGKKNHGQIDD